MPTFLVNAVLGALQHCHTMAARPSCHRAAPIMQQRDIQTLTINLGPDGEPKGNAKIQLRPLLPESEFIELNLGPIGDHPGCSFKAGNAMHMAKACSRASIRAWRHFGVRGGAGGERREDEEVVDVGGVR